MSPQWIHTRASESHENEFSQRILSPTQLPLLLRVGARPRRAEASCLRQSRHFLARKPWQHDFPIAYVFQNANILLRQRPHNFPRAYSQHSGLTSSSYSDFSHHATVVFFPALTIRVYFEASSEISIRKKKTAPLFRLT